MAWCWTGVAWANVDLLSIRSLRVKFNDFWIKCQIFLEENVLENILWRILMATYESSQYKDVVLPV